MAISVLLAAKRALVKTLLYLAGIYGVTLDVNRDSDDTYVTAACRKLARKVHPDKGGSTRHAQQLFDVRAEWDKARKAGNAAGRPKPTTEQAAEHAKKKKQKKGTAQQLGDGVQSKGYRVNSTGVLLTYFNILLGQWGQFVSEVRAKISQWKVKRWACTMEATRTGRLHVHLMVQFTRKVDVSSKSFTVLGSAPRADPNDLLGEGWNRGKLQDSLNRAFFYVFADKVGTQHDRRGKAFFAGNYAPTWTEHLDLYAVRGRWPENLWKAGKLTHDMYEQYLFLCRDGVIARKRNLDAVREYELAKEDDDQLQVRTKRLRGNPRIFRPFPPVPQATEWLARFKQDELRYPLLIVTGKSRTGKTEWAQSLFKKPLVLKVGKLTHFPEGMRQFDRRVHDAVILDDLRDYDFLVQHQEKVQGKYNGRVEFASTPGGGLAYFRDLFAVPVVATCNGSTKNKKLLETDDFLGHADNRVLLDFPPWPARARA